VTNRPRALIVLIAVFLAGGIVGSAGSYYWLRRSEGSRIRVRGNVRAPVQERQRLPELLKLTPDQENRFKEIMAESRRQLDALRAEQAPKIEEIRSETNRKLYAILNGEQQKEFAAFLKEMENRRKRSPRGRGFEAPR
jgi:Spy/CpxP family protein refolding chaperone